MDLGIRGRRAIEGGASKGLGRGIRNRFMDHAEAWMQEARDVLAGLNS